MPKIFTENDSTLILMQMRIIEISEPKFWVILIFINIKFHE